MILVGWGTFDGLKKDARWEQKDFESGPCDEGQFFAENGGDRHPSIAPESDTGHRCGPLTGLMVSTLRARGRWALKQ